MNPIPKIVDLPNETHVFETAEGTNPNVSRWYPNNATITLAVSDYGDDSIHMTSPGGYRYWFRASDLAMFGQRLLEYAGAVLKASAPIGLTLINRTTKAHLDYPGGMTISLVGDMFVVRDASGAQIGTPASAAEHLPAPMLSKDTNG